MNSRKAYEHEPPQDVPPNHEKVRLAILLRIDQPALYTAHLTWLGDHSGCFLTILLRSYSSKPTLSRSASLAATFRDMKSRRALSPRFEIMLYAFGPYFEIIALVPLLLRMLYTSGPYLDVTAVDAFFPSLVYTSGPYLDFKVTAPFLLTMR